MRIIIAGSRDFTDYKAMKEKTLKIVKEMKSQGFDTSRENLEIISGNANGADKLGERFAKEFNLKVVQFIPDWDGLGKRAGYVRNGDMANYAKGDNGVLIAFWNGSKGTKHMIDLANKQELKVYVVNF